MQNEEIASTSVWVRINLNKNKQTKKPAYIWDNPGPGALSSPGRREEEERIKFNLVLSHKRKSSNVEMIIVNCQVQVVAFPAGNHGFCVL